ncbi:MalY/PatB family protein, partial [Candidatus Riflebacteria bacterium]
MSPFDFDTPIDRRGTGSIKWDKYRDRDIIPLWVADMDFSCPPRVIAALHNRVEHGIFGYTYPGQELTDAVLSMLNSCYDWQVQAAWIVWLPGLVTGLNLACSAVANEGEEVITTVPIYPPFMSAPGNNGQNLVKNPLLFRENRWQLDLEHLSRSITDKTRLFLHCHPHNPAGRAFSKEELFALWEVIRKQNIVICSDEIHCGLILDEGMPHIPFASLSPQIAERSITLMAPSKTYN